MKRILAFLFVFSIHFIPSFAEKGSNIDNAKANEWIQSKAIGFIENKGQMTDMGGNPAPFVLFKFESPGMTVFITEKGLTYTLFKPLENKEKKSADPVANQISDRSENGSIIWNRVDVLLEGAKIKSENISKQGPNTHFSQYFLAHCPQGITDVHSFKKIIISEIYPGIDWVLYNSEKTGLKYDFIVHPGADPSVIKLLYSSEQPIELTEKGNIEIKTAIGSISENAPFTYTLQNKKTVESHFKLISTQKVNDYYQSTVQFQIDNYPTSQTIIIDPQLVWSTFCDAPDAKDIVCDPVGNLFVTGTGPSLGFPALNPGGGAYFQSTSGASSGAMNDAMIMKFSNNGVLIWATYYGGIYYDYGLGITSDASGNIFVTGETESPNFPLYNAGGSSFYQNTIPGVGADIFMLKFSNSGVRQWATFMGGSSYDRAFSICSDYSGNVYISGVSQSGDFPTLNPGGGSYFQSSLSGPTDVIISKFSNSGTLLWSTYYGGSGGEYGNSICTDGAGNIILAGSTFSSNFPVLDPGSGAHFQGTLSGAGDGFISKFSGSGVPFWCTYFGGSGAVLEHEGCVNVTTDLQGNIFIGGSSNQTNLPIMDPGSGAYFLGVPAAGLTSYQYVAPYIAKFDNMGVMKWGTYYNQFYWSNPASSLDLITDQCGNVYWSMQRQVTMPSPYSICSTDFVDNTFSGTDEVVLVKFSNNGNHLWSTFLGGDWVGSLPDEGIIGAPLALDRSNNLFVSGGLHIVTSSSFPLVNPGGSAYYDPTHSGGWNIFLCKFKNTLSLNVTSTTPNCNCAGTASVVPTTGCPPYKYTWYDNLNNVIDSTQNISNLCAGNYHVFVQDASYNCKTDSSAFLSNSWIPSITGPSTVCSAEPFSLTANNGVSYTWSTGDTTAGVTLMPPASNSYSVIINNGIECVDTLSQNITINASPIISSNAPTICAGQTAQMIANGASSYSWSAGATATGTNTAEANPITTTTYTVIGTTLGCNDTIISVVNVNSVPTAFTSPDTTIGGGASAALYGSGGGTYNWSPSTGLSCTDCSNPIASPYETTTYCLIVTDSNNCTDREYITITVEACATNKNLDVPNAFSPNEDGINDELCLEGWISCVAEFQILIYDRWGEKVFESNDANFCWDGIYKGQALDPAVFVYYINATLYNKKTSVQKTGNISLLR